MMYGFLVLFILLSAFFFKNKKTYCILCSFFIILVIGLRNYNMGCSDTNQLYIPYFNYFSNLSFTNVIDFIEKIDSEYGFWILTFLVSKITTSGTIYLLVVSSITYGLLGRFIYKHSKYPMLSFVMLLSLNYFGYGFYILRHMMALAILTLAYDQLLKDNKLKTVLYILLASLFHKSALIFLIMILLKNYKMKRYIVHTVVSIIVATVFGMFFLNRFITFFFSNSHFEYYINGVGNNYTTLFINLLLFLFIYIYNNERNENIDVNLKLQYVSIVLSAIVPYLSEFMRLASMFSIYSIVTLPNCIYNMKDKKIKLMYYTLFVIIFILYFFMFSLNNNQIKDYSFWR